MDNDTRVLLIGGPSHAGKSTIGRLLGARPGWTYATTDTLARHPGRPWPEHRIPPHVAEHYLTLSLDELIASVTQHYSGTIWPLAEALIRAHAAPGATEKLVLEGSALSPERVSTLNIASFRTVWLVAEESVLRARIYRESKFETLDARGKELVTKFLARTLHTNALTGADARRLGLPLIQVGAASSPEEIAARCLRQAAIPFRPD